jgi:hypothetical protein
VQNESERQRILGLGGVIVHGSRIVHLVKVKRTKPCCLFCFESLVNIKYREPEPGDDLGDYCAQGYAWFNLTSQVSPNRFFSFLFFFFFFFCIFFYKYKIARMGCMNYSRLALRGLPPADMELIKHCLYTLITAVPSIKTVELTQGKSKKKRARKKRENFDLLFEN